MHPAMDSKQIPSLLPPENGELSTFEISYLAPRANAAIVKATHAIVSKSPFNALASFHRAVPKHGRILAVKKVLCS